MFSYHGKNVRLLRKFIFLFTILGPREFACASKLRKHWCLSPLSGNVARSFYSIILCDYGTAYITQENCAPL